MKKFSSSVFENWYLRPFECCLWKSWMLKTFFSIVIEESRKRNLFHTTWYELKFTIATAYSTTRKFTFDTKTVHIKCEVIHKMDYRLRFTYQMTIVMIVLDLNSDLGTRRQNKKTPFRRYYGIFFSFVRGRKYPT